MEQKDTSPKGTPVMTPEWKSEIREAVLKRIANGEDKDTVLREAAEQGDAVCQLAYGINLDMPSWGRGAKWWKQSVKQNCVYAWVWLALFYLDKPDIAKEWFTKAAMAGNLFAQYSLALLLDPRNKYRARGASYLKALDAYKMAASNKFEMDDDLRFLVRLLETGALKDSLLVECVTDRKDIGRSQCSVGEIYMDGKLGERNITEAIAWLEKAEANGDSDASFHLGRLYARDWAGEYKNVDKALSILTPIAEEPNGRWQAKAQLEIGNIYMGEKNYETAVSWFYTAAMLGDYMAQNNMGVCCDQGIGVARNYRKAMKWFLLSAKQKYALACCNIGIMYEHGRGVGKNRRKARKWYVRAIKLGEKDLSGLCRVSRLKLNGNGGKSHKLYSLRFL